MDIRLATKDDVGALVKFYKNYSKEDAEKRMECYTSHNYTIVALEDGKIVGALQFYLKEELSSGMAEFEEVFVAEEWRGKGVGKKILEKGIETVKAIYGEMRAKARRIYLFVGKNNEPARKLYERVGFKETAEVGDIFADGKEELFYVLKF